MRVVLFTGKGGVGKTTLAAGTAALAAERGLRALVLSTDAAHSLGDALGLEPEPGVPVQVSDGLFVEHVDTRRRLDSAWGGIQDYLLTVMDAAGVDPLEAEELTVLPGAEEVLALMEVRDRVRSGHYDVVVVDCAPTAETLRLLALPDALTWYMDRIWPTERRVIRALRPVLSKATGVPMPGDPVLDALETLHAELTDVREVLTDEHASVRLVLTPESVVVAESRRALTLLSLYGYRVDAALVNRLVPEGDDPWLRAWVASQGVRLAEVEADLDPVPVLRVPYRAGEPVGRADLLALAAEAYGDVDPVAPPRLPPPLDVRRDGDRYLLRLALPLVARGEVDLARRGDELLVSVGPHRRALALPSALRRCHLRGASVEDGVLTVRFVPDPEARRST